MFYLDSDGNYRVSEIDELGIFEHGFGTKSSKPPAEVATLHQVHSDIVIAADGRAGCLGDGDALLSQAPGRLVAVKTADCIPILLFDPANRAVAAVHAGWRGTVRQICRRTADAMCQYFGTRPDDLYAAIGPGIGRCCFEVGPEVAVEFGESGRVHVDLETVNRQQLADSGIPAERIFTAHLCTVCEGDSFWSYRREKEQAGRMFSFAGIR